MEGRTPPVTQLAARDMDTVDDVQDASLPSSIDEFGFVHGALKYSQLGAEAWSVMLTELMDCATIPNKN